MLMAVITFFLLLLQAALWLPEVLVRIPLPITRGIGEFWPLMRGSAMYGFLGASLVGVLCAFLACRRDAGLGKAHAILAAMAMAGCARLSRIMGDPLPSTALWGVAFVMAIGAGYIFRRAVAYPPSLANLNAAPDSASGDSEPKVERISRSVWIGVVIVQAFAAIFWGYRLTQNPGELYSFGTNALISAQRLLLGQLDWNELILFHEMTQAECGYSLPFVLWHALFQILCGGMSVFAGRLAIMVASLLSVIFMFRVGRSIGGARFGLLCMIIFAALPLTAFQSRVDGIFGFSALLVLIALDIVLSFIRRPTFVRSILVGFSAPLVCYGLANIKLLFIAGLLTFVVAFFRSRTLRQGSWKLVFSFMVAGLVLLPQLTNLSQVKQQMRGRGEHIFGGVLKQAALNDPQGRGLWEMAKLQLEINFAGISHSILGPWDDQASTLPSILVVPLVVGVGLSIAQALRPDRFFMLAIAVGAYFAPLIAIPMTWNRLLLLNIAHTPLIAVVWFELYEIFKKASLRRLLIPMHVVALLISLASGLVIATSFLHRKSQLGEVVKLIETQAHGHVVFFTDKIETSLNYLRWNPPLLGRSSDASIPVTGIRENGVVATSRVIEFLEIPALLLSNDPIPPELSSKASWKTEQAPGNLSAMWHNPMGMERRPVVLAVDLLKFDSSKPLFFGRLSYASANLFEAEIPHEGIDVHFDLSEPLEKAALMVRKANSYSAAVKVFLDGSELSVLEESEVTGDKRTVWFSVAGVPPGRHLIRILPVAQGSQSADEVVIVGVSTASEQR